MLGEKLRKARAVKNNEFFTRIDDVREMVVRYAPHLIGKSIYCNADDHRYSNFYKYFVDNFDNLQLRSLTATAYSPQGMPGLFAGGGVVARYDGRESTVDTLSGNGDYRSAECMQLLREHDVVITNPPFTGWREYLQTLIENDKKFLIMGGTTPFGNTYPFRMYMQGRVWFADGSPKRNSSMNFMTPEGATKIISACWYTNLGEPSQRNFYEPLTRTYNASEYSHYDDRTDVININRIKDIPTDYYGLMGVPIKYLVQHNNAEFEVVGLLGNQHRYVNGKKLYNRVIIRRR